MLMVDDRESNTLEMCRDVQKARFGPRILCLLIERTFVVCSLLEDLVLRMKLLVMLAELF